MINSKGGLETLEKAVKKTYSDFNNPAWMPIVDIKNSTNDDFLNCLYKYLKNKSLLNEKISIISHSKYIKNIVLLNYPKNRLYNNESVNFNYEFDSKSKAKNRIIKKTEKKRNNLGCVHDNISFECLINKGNTKSKIMIRTKKIRIKP